MSQQSSEDNKIKLNIGRTNFIFDFSLRRDIPSPDIINTPKNIGEKYLKSELQTEGYWHKKEMIRIKLILMPKAQI